MREINREIVSALICSSDGKLLMGKKNPDKGGVYSDCWHIPGGGIDDGEAMRDALRREIYEEVGIKITSAKLVDNLGKGVSEKVQKDAGEKVMCRMKFNVFKVQLDSISKKTLVTLNDDLVEFKWFKTDDLSNIKLTPPSIELFRRLKLIT
ncbi:MAG: NUDIX hydrolase [Candidatus Dojkabacteria bacterium]